MELMIKLQIRFVFPGSVWQLRVLYASVVVRFSVLLLFPRAPLAVIFLAISKIRAILGDSLQVPIGSQNL